MHTDYMPPSKSSEDFKKEWEEVAEFEKKGRPESALKVVEQIQMLAKQKFIKPQIVKSVLFKAKLMNQMEEDGMMKSITYFEGEHQGASEPVKSILASQLASSYNDYLNQNLWKIGQRTEIN